MSIDKNSSGFPEMDPHKATTKVNLWMVVGVLVFFAITAGVVAWFWASNR